MRRLGLEYLQELSLGYWKSQVVFAGVELGLFDLLAQGGKESKEIAQATQTNPRAAEMLLNALVALKLLGKKGGLYENTLIASEYLVKGNPLYQGHRIHHLHNLWERWARLQEAIRIGKSVVEDKEQDPKRLKDFMLSMHNHATIKAKKIIKKLDLSASGGFRSLLDLGGGPGTYAIEFAKANSELKAVVFDLAPNIEIAKEFIKESGLASRVFTQAGDCLKDSLGEEKYDAVFVSNLLHVYAPDTNKEILKKCHQALMPRGKVIIHDFLLNKAHTGPTYPVLFSLNMLLGTCEGAAYSKEEIDEWLLEVGFKSIKTIKLDRDSALIIGEKKPSV